MADTGAIRPRRSRKKETPYEPVQAAVATSKPPPPPPPAPEATPMIADAPQQIQAKRGRGRPRKESRNRSQAPTAGADPELKVALDDARKKVSPERLRISSPSETPQMKPHRCRSRVKDEAETPQITVVPFTK